MKPGKERSTRSSRKSPKPQNGLSIPKFLENYPNILELYLKRPDTHGSYISPTFCVFFDGDGLTGRVRDRAKRRGVWKHAQTIEGLLEKIDAEMGLSWPDWRFDDPADRRAYSEQKSTCAV